jgi:hypothetical protein
MAHGYLRDWDEGWGRSDENERSDRNWRGRDRDWNDRDRHSAFTLGGLQRADDRWNSRDQRDWERSPRDFRSRQDDHYLSWRDKQMEALDRDYADYCREREEQFHHDFDSWRRERAGNPQPLRTGMTQSGMSHDPSGEYQLSTESIFNPGKPDPVADATLGTNSSEGAPQRSRIKPEV